MMMHQASSQSVFTQTYKIDEDKVSKTNTTVVYTPNPSFKTCACDRINGTCDPFCCCDENDCSKAFID